jgi:hypothetical protein
MRGRQRIRRSIPSFSDILLELSGRPTRCLRADAPWVGCCCRECSCSRRSVATKHDRDARFTIGGPRLRAGRGGAAKQIKRTRSFTEFTRSFLAPPIGRSQIEARIALVSLGVSIGLDQPTVRGTANNEKTQITRVHGQGARLEAMSLQPAFAFFALFAVPFPCFAMRYPCTMTLAGKR